MRVVLVTGSRDWGDESAVHAALCELAPSLVLVGDCKTGGDRMTREWCRKNGVRFRVFAAAWRVDLQDRPWAGPERNEHAVWALEHFRAKGDDCKCLAFPLPGGRGTQGTMELARAAGFDVDDRGRV